MCLPLHLAELLWVWVFLMPLVPHTFPGKSKTLAMFCKQGEEFTT